MRPATRVCSVMSDSVNPGTVAHQAPLSMGFSRQQYWSGLPCPSPGDLPDPGIKPASLAPPALAGGLFSTEAPGKPKNAPLQPAPGTPLCGALGKGAGPLVLLRNRGPR